MERKNRSNRGGRDGGGRRHKKKELDERLLKVNDESRIDNAATMEVMEEDDGRTAKCSGWDQHKIEEDRPVDMDMDSHENGDSGKKIRVSRENVHNEESRAKGGIGGKRKRGVGTAELDDKMFSGEAGVDDARASKKAEERGQIKKGEKEEIQAPSFLPTPIIIPKTLTLPMASAGLDNTDTATETKLDYFAAHIPRLHGHLITRLNNLGILKPFPLQVSAFPHIAQNLHSTNQVPDILFSAPTGSGKTLAYTLPIVNSLMDRTVKRLRCIIIVPTRDLVAQVRATLDGLIKGTDLKVYSCSGSGNFKMEQLVMMDEDSNESKIDILVSTPGRLIDHIRSGLDVGAVRWLVMDEADRLLGQEYHEWLKHLYGALNSRTGIFIGRREVNKPVTQRIVVSATLELDAGQIGTLKLWCPKYFAIEVTDSQGKKVVGKESFQLPDTLEEFRLECDANLKPLMIVYFLLIRKVKKALVFVKSIDHAVRLAQLLQAFLSFENYKSLAETNGVQVSSFSSSLPSSARKQILRSFTKGEISCLITSDLLTRGFDAPVDMVINYDPPINVKQYVHRVGRTARAGNTGAAVSVLSQEEMRYFKGLMKQVNRTSPITKIKFTNEEKSEVDLLERTFPQVLESIRSNIPTTHDAMDIDTPVDEENSTDDVSETEHEADEESELDEDHFPDDEGDEVALLHDNSGEDIDEQEEEDAQEDARHHVEVPSSSVTQLLIPKNLEKQVIHALDEFMETYDTWQRRAWELEIQERRIKANEEKTRY